jgi:hypothetical protein
MSNILSEHSGSPGPAIVPEKFRDFHQTLHDNSGIAKFIK